VIPKLFHKTDCIQLYLDHAFAESVTIYNVLSNYPVIQGSRADADIQCNGYVFAYHLTTDLFHYLGNFNYSVKDKLFIFVPEYIQVVLENITIFRNADVIISGGNMQLYALSSWVNFPREFNPVNEILPTEEFEKEYGIPDMKGRQLNASTFFCPPFVYIDNGEYYFNEDETFFVPD
jgi:hypothetical protein